MAPLDAQMHDAMVAAVLGTISAEERVQLERQLEQSPALREEYDWLKMLAEDLSTLEPSLQGGAINMAHEVMHRVAAGPLRGLGAPGDVELDRLADALCPALEDQKAPPVDVPKSLDASWLSAAVEDFDTLAKIFAEKAPPDLDLVGPVMEAVFPAIPRETPHALFSVRFRRCVPRAAWAALAAAVVLASIVGALHMVFTGGENEGTGPPVAHVPETQPHILPEERLVHAALPTDLNVVRPPGDLDSTVPPEDALFEETNPPLGGPLTVPAIIEARRKGAADPEARKRIRQWASLTEDQARTIVARTDASPEAIVAAAAALDTGERAMYLLRAVGYLPEQPAARLALADAYAEQPGGAPAAKSQLHKLHELDGGNALPYYLEAQILLEQGERDQALEMLERAQALEAASAYALEEASYQQEALLAGGMESDAAQLLSALTAGENQYDFLCDFGNDLLQYARQYAELGDLQAAERILQSVQRLGQQLNEGAAFVPEQLAGLDLQRAAIESLSNLYEEIGSTDGQNALAAQLLELEVTDQQIEEFLSAMEGLIQTTADVDSWLALAGVLLDSGSVPLLEFVASGVTSVWDLLEKVGNLGS